MSDVVQQIVHPLIEEMQAKYEVEMAELRSAHQEQIDERNERIDNAESSAWNQNKFLNELIKDKESIDLKQVIKVFDSYRPSRRETDWDVLGTVRDLLKKIQPEVVYRSEGTRTERVEVLPANLTINGKNYTSC